MTDLLSQLPEIPEKAGWPWTIAFDSKMYADDEWPRISIVTPSFNQGAYIEETIRSVILQNYPNLEYIIIDGGSTDNTLEVIRKYEQWITVWVSEKDNGQTDAISKGLKYTTGEVFNWLNSDDYLVPGALFHIGTAFRNGCDVFAGAVNNFIDKINIQDHLDNYVGVYKNSELSITDYFEGGFYFHQPGAWFRRAILKDINIDHSLQYCFDLKLILNILENSPKIAYTDAVLVNFRLHQASKTVSAHEKFVAEHERIRLSYADHADEGISSAARKYLVKAEWHTKISTIYNSKSTRLFKIMAIVIGIMADPFHRANRFSMGAIKKVISC